MRLFVKILSGRVLCLLAGALLLTGLFTEPAAAHPLGNFTINHFSRLQVNNGQLQITYVIDMAEIPAFQELRKMASNVDGVASPAELATYVERAAASYQKGLDVTLDGTRAALKLKSANAGTMPGAGGLQTLRLEYQFAVLLPATEAGITHRVLYEDTNQADRIGWREVVVEPGTGVTVFNSSVVSKSISNELRTYPADMLASPLNERRADFSWVIGPAPSGAVLLGSRGRRITPSRDESGSPLLVRKLTPVLALLGVLVASLLIARRALRAPSH